MMDRNFQLYIPYACNIKALNTSINSAIPQMKKHSTWEGKKIVVLNDTPEPIDHLIENIDEVEIFEFPYRIKMTHAQQGNWMIRDAIHKKQPFCLTIHSDAEMLDGAVQEMLERLETIYDTKWGVQFNGAGWCVFAAYNLKFFIEEDIWFDPFLFPFYYMDNHMLRLMSLWGWDVIMSSDKKTILHKSSHYLKEDPVFRRKNDIAFGYHGGIYSAIWGGLPGQEKSNDKYANGTIRRK